jgi:hypothetical protein
MNSKNLLLLIGLVAIFFSCKKEFTGFRSNDRDKSLVHEIDFQYLNARSKVRYQEGDKQVNGSVNVRMRKDSVIWFSVSPSIGLEVTRCLITQDTILIINRMEKEYYVFTYPEISRYFNFNIDYSLIQSILIGNLIEPLEDKSRVARENNYFLIKQSRGPLDIQSFVNRDTHKIETVLLNEKPTNNFMTLKYSEFEPIAMYLFPHACQVNLTYRSGDKGPLVTSVNLTHSKADISDKPLKFPFNIPDKYDAFK